MTFSLKRRLLLILLSVTAVTWLFSAYTSYRDTRHEIDELFDAQMAQSARTLLSVAGHELIELAGTPMESAHIHFIGDARFTSGGHHYEHKLAYQLWEQPNNTLLVRTLNAPETALSDKVTGYSTRDVHGESWRVFSLQDEDTGFQIQVGESMAIRNELAGAIARRTGMPLLVALPLLALLISVGISRGLQPLQQLAKSVERRAPGNLEPVNEAHAPTEIRPLLTALNSLFKRLSEAFENERRFTADAAHELRTPLAALKVQAQVARRSGNDEERNRALAKILEGVDRATRLVEQLLTLARVDPASRLTSYEQLDLDELTEEVIAGFAGEAAVKGIELELNAGTNCIVTGQRDSLAILLRNLIDNAIRYTPDEGKVEVYLIRSDDGVLLRIDDSGPGIEPNQRERIFDRFYRQAGQEISGSGLGLSIVKRIAAVHGAAITLDKSPLGGLEVQLHFPPPKNQA